MRCAAYAESICRYLRDTYHDTILESALEGQDDAGRSSSPDSDAACAALGPLPTEILEGILLPLDFWSLARCLRVSKSWNAAISRSPQLQQALFLNPSVEDVSDGPALVFKLVIDTRRLRGVQRQLRPIFWIDIGKVYNHPPRLQRTKPSAEDVVFNPILQNMFRSAQSLDASSPPTTLETEHVRRKDPAALCKTARGLPGAIWRKMLISQPPAHTITMECDFTFDPSYRCKAWTPYTVEGGITMEDLFMLVQSRIESSFDDYLRDQTFRLGDDG
ncbi:uncharacterized protein M421DRAFT_9210 [Didymella exigua CBS 183.55]|uniref:F-box domain-containing protein n=1 Tax=Didymella exigua CBS 183.55 TaxID=1150837 RepID=A0A6A5RA45_9PLEO|nr:uncharacterized protein M421DRAFT_9210 [Didymella exigua CBS 183.55]KAF1923914.1 hypothetical protein M421DRAFT_9210 [Didymella exigua CBS 183.55]